MNSVKQTGSRRNVSVDLAGNDFLPEVDQATKDLEIDLPVNNAVSCHQDGSSLINSRTN
jgi:hypothetical protein